MGKALLLFAVPSFTDILMDKGFKGFQFDEMYWIKAILGKEATF